MVSRVCGRKKQSSVVSRVCGGKKQSSVVSRVCGEKKQSFQSVWWEKRQGDQSKKMKKNIGRVRAVTWEAVGQ